MKRNIIAVMCLVLHPGPVRSDVSLSIIEYRVLKDVGQVRITTSLIHEPAIQERVHANRGAFEREGIILVDVTAEHRFVREERIGTHTVRTVVTLLPPIGRGYRGGLSTAHVLVTVDGRARADCPYDDGNVEISDLSILPLDGFIRVRGTVDRSSIDELMPLLGDEEITADWLMARARSDHPGEVE